MVSPKRAVNARARNTGTKNTTSSMMNCSLFSKFPFDVIFWLSGSDC